MIDDDRIFIYQWTNSLSLSTLSFSHNIISTHYFDYTVLLLQSLKINELASFPKITSFLSLHGCFPNTSTECLKTMTAGAKPFEKTNRCCVTFSWSFPDYWSSQALLQIKTTPLWHQIFLSVAVSFHAHLLFLYFWNCNDYAVVGRATFHLAKPQCLHTNICLYIHQWKLQSWRNLKRDSPRLSRYLCLMVKEWKTLAKFKINNENGLWVDPEQFNKSFWGTSKVVFLQAPLQLSLVSMQGQ